jgi:hypothetical protein
LREKVVCSGAEAGELYMLYAYVGDMDFKYIDQSVADAGGSVTFNYYPMDCDEELTVKVVGKFNGEIQEKSVEPQAQCVSSVALSEDYIELNVGAEHRLKAVLEPLYATNRSVTWSSSDDNIVTVDENGVVTAVAPGEAEITVTTAERGFTAAEFKAAQTDGWEKQYQYKVGKKKVYMAPSAAEAQGLVRADKHPKSTRYGRQNPISERWNSEEHLAAWRAAWADVSNRYLERAGREERIDHRSNAARGLDEIPTIHEGVTAQALERKGIISDRCEINRQIKADNALLRELKVEIKKLAALVVRTVPAIAEGLEKLRSRVLIFCYQLSHIRSGKSHIQKSLAVWKPELERYTGLVQQIKEKSKERKSLVAEKKELPIYHVKRQKALAVRIAELTEDLEELCSEKALLLQKFEYAEDAGAEAFRKDIATMEAGLKKLETREQKYSVELDKALTEYAELKAQTADFDPVELYKARNAIRPVQEKEVEQQLEGTMHEKPSLIMLLSAKQEASRLLGEDAENRQARQMIMRRRSTEQLKRSHLKTDRCKIER